MAPPEETARTDLNEVVGHIYASGLEQEATLELLRIVTRFFRAGRTQLQSRVAASGELASCFICDAVVAAGDPTRRYVTLWGARDPAWSWLADRAPGELLRCDREWDERFVAESPFHAEYLAPDGLRWTMAVRYREPDGRSAMLTLLRADGDGPFDDADAAHLRQLVPHLERAARVAGRLAHHVSALQAASDLVRTLPTPCVVTDHAGRCLDGNAAFQQCVGRRSLELVTGRVRFSHPNVQHDWETALHETHVTGIGRTVRLPRPDGGGWSVSLRPWQPLDGSAARPERRLILAVFEDKVPEAQLAPDLMASASRLTHAELEVLAGLMKGLPAKSIASHRGASVNTVRSQIMAILGKTGFSSQKELIASFAASGFTHSVSSQSLGERADVST